MTRGAGAGSRASPEPSLRRRVLGETVLAILALVLLGAFAFSFALDRILFTLAEDDARGQATELAGLLASGELSTDRVRQEVGAHGSIIQVVAAQAGSDGSHQVIAESNRSGREVALPDPLTTRSSGASLSASSSTTNSSSAGEPLEIPEGSGNQWALVGERAVVGDRSLDVLVAAPLTSESRTVHTTVLWLLGAAAVVFIVVVFLIRRSLEVALRPVRLITNEVERIHRAGASERVTVPATGDEIAQLGTVMNRMLDRLDSADQVTREFLSNASHELRSPLTTMRALIEGQPAEHGDATADRDQILQTEVLRMQRLVDDIFTLAKADDARLNLHHDEVDLDEIVAAEVARLRATTGLIVEASIDAVRVIGDEGRLTQALRNLTDNAARHARHRVEVRLIAGESEAMVTVDNDGPVVDEADRERIFERFVRLEPGRPRDDSRTAPLSGGNGLGLTISRTLLAAHGGRVRATVTESGWCRFEIHLPRPVEHGVDDDSP